MKKEDSDDVIKELDKRLTALRSACDAVDDRLRAYEMALSTTHKQHMIEIRRQREEIDNTIMKDSGVKEQTIERKCQEAAAILFAEKYPEINPKQAISQAVIDKIVVSIMKKGDFKRLFMRYIADTIGFEILRRNGFNVDVVEYPEDKEENEPI
jgi:deoxycytidylate deaminase